MEVKEKFFRLGKMPNTLKLNGISFSLNFPKG
jgi:hypothetical protein